MNKKLFFSVLVLMLSSAFMYAQKTVTGTVTDNNGLPLLGVNIIVKGTSNGTSTDFDGNYAITVPNNEAILVYSFIGFINIEVAVGTQTVISIILEENVHSLESVLITAQGIKKSKKALGYAVATLESDEFERRPEADLARVLQGKIAGVTITNFNGETGAGTNIRIRSSLSVNQSNEPLIVVNNVPFQGSMKDIDPNDVKEISILKGLNASILYGSEGRNGVILIQTKSGTGELGKRSFKVSLSTTTYFNEVANLPDYQNKYGQGADNFFNAGFLGNWGPAFTELDEVVHPYAFYGNLFPEFDGLMIPYTAKPDNVEKVFHTGIGRIYSLNISSTAEKSAFNLSAGYTQEEGIIGNNDLKRFNLGLGGQMQVTDKLNVSANLNYSTRRVNRLQSDEIFDLLLYIPRNIDITTLPYEHPQTGASIYYRSSENPLWVINNTGKYDDIVRIFGSINVNYELSDKWSLSYRVGIDNNQQDEFDYSNKGGFDDNEFGFLELDYDKRVTIDQSVILSLNNVELGENIGLEAQIGVNSKYLKGKSINSFSVDQNVFDFFRPSNFNVTSAGYSEYNENLAGLFAQAEFSYDDFLYVTLSGRNDWGSTVEQENRTIFYPGASFSFIPTSAFDIRSDGLNYLKIRAAYGTSSGYPSRFKTRSILETNPRRFVTVDGQIIITNSTDEEFANPNLKPELHKEFEFGIEGSFWNSRITLEASVFKRISENQILEAERPPSTGYTETLINAGRIDTKGLEIDLGIDVLKAKDFMWNMRNIFTKYDSEVIDLPQNEISLGNSRFAIEGEPLGILKGSYVMRDDEGNILINPANGEVYISSEQGKPDRIIGSAIPDFIYTNINDISYKGFTLSTQFEYRKGGRIESASVENLVERGVTRDTENREGTFVIPGVMGDPAAEVALLDVNGNKIPNNIQVDANRTVFSNIYNADGYSTWDATVIRLREVSLGYTFNNLKGIESITISLSGRNLWYNAPDFPKYVNFDPENDGGFGDQNVPTTKRFGLGIAITF